MQSYGLNSIISRPTRVTSNSATILDHIWCKKLQNMTTCGIILSSLTDHYPIFATTKYYQRNNRSSQAYESFYTRVRNDSANDVFRNILLQTNWNNLMLETCVVSMFSSFNKIIIHAYNAAYPMIKRKRKIKDIEQPYIDNEIKFLIKEKHKLQKKYFRYPITYNDEFKRIKNKLAKLIANAKRIYYQNKLTLNKNDPKKSWKIINETMGRNTKKNTIENIRVDGEVTESDPQTMANRFNCYFAKVGRDLADNFDQSENYQQYLTETQTCIFKFSSINIELIQKKIF